MQYKIIIISDSRTARENKIAYYKIVVATGLAHCSNDEYQKCEFKTKSYLSTWIGLGRTSNGTNEVECC